MTENGSDDREAGRSQPGSVPAQPYSIDSELANASRAPRGLFPAAVRPAVFIGLWISLGILIAILAVVAVQYDHRVGW